MLKKQMSSSVSTPFFYAIDENNLRNDVDLSNYPDVKVNLYCYHVYDQTTIPFLQVMLSNDRRNDGFLHFPEISHIDYCYHRTNYSLDRYVHGLVGSLLSQMSCTNIQIRTEGMILQHGVLFIVLNLTNTNIDNLFLTSNDPIFFATVTEIVNVCSVCNVPIHEYVRSFFLDNEHLLTLTNPMTMELYETPDIVYSAHKKFKVAQFENIFGQSKQLTEYGYHYYFCNDFTSAINKKGIDGGGGGLNRMVVFVGNFCTLKEEDLSAVKDIEDAPTLSISQYFIDEQIDTVLILPTDKNKTPIIIVKSYDQHIPLSYHKLRNAFSIE